MSGYDVAKRALDVVTAAAVLVVLAVPMAFVAWGIHREMGPGGVFFRQKRPGRHGRPFHVLKFRSMREAFDAEGNPLPDAERTPPFGWFVRRWSIDELPQLINVLRAEMSLVGPRPLLLEYLDRYPPQYLRRHDVPPGITGWAQVHGRDFVTFKQRLDMDVWYVDHRSFWLDIRILWLTLLALLSPSIAPLDQAIEDVDDVGLYVSPSPSGTPVETPTEPTRRGP